MKKSSKKYFGFTLVELIIVIIILAILATIAFVSFQNYTSQTRDTKRVSDLTQISKGLDIFQVTSGTLPTPDNPTTYTGGNSTLLKGKINSKVLSNLAGEVFDPSTKTEYTYATIGNGKYYQLGADSENLVTSVFNSAFADSKSSIVKGNYLFDPSLPSLIISSGSSLYDPNNCFVINGGTNLVSNNTNCIPKSSTSLKNFDSSLVGYWDMETTTGSTFLKDLSGNGNDGIFSGGMIYTSSFTGGVNGKGLIFTGAIDFGLGNYIVINDSNSLDLKNYTITMIYKNTSNFDSTVLISKGTLDTRPCIVSGSNTCENYGIMDYRVNNRIHTFTTTIDGRFGVNYSYKDNYSLNYNIVTCKKYGVKLDCYLNGKVMNNSSFSGLSTIGSNEDTITNNNPLTIGSRLGPNKLSFNGIIDDIKIYNRALSDDQILQQAKSAGF